MISLQKKLSIFILLWLFSACANIQSPSGGPSDKTAPQLKSSTPQQNSINFKGTDITLEFNEQVNAEKLKNSLVLTPAKEDDFKVKVKKKTVLIHFEKEFEPNTTYTLNFSDAITDLTENNPVRDLTLSFSTGPFMDSISLNGTVVDLKTNAPQENITVALYKAYDTINLKTGKPVFFTLTGKAGSFNFKNLKNGHYNLYAFQDKNRNLHYEENEKIGVIENLDLTKNKSNIVISLTTLDSKSPEIVFIRPGKEKTDLKFNEGIILKKIRYTDSSLFVPYTMSEDAKTLSVFNNQNTYDSIPLNLLVSDSTGNNAEIKRNIIFEKKDNSKEPFTVKVEPQDLKIEPGYFNIKMIFNKPVKRFNKNIIVTVDKSKIEIPDSNWVWNPNKTSLSINKKIKTADTIVFESDSLTFISIANDSLAKQKFIFSTKKEENYGTIRGSVETQQPAYILELLDNNYKIIKSLRNTKTFNFKYLSPASYNIRVIVDANNNGQWDNGNLSLKKLPEKIIYYKEKIELRANWEIENIVIKF
jgi:uncharacterized protein (DUF2141 family)